MLVKRNLILLAEGELASIAWGNFHGNRVFAVLSSQAYKSNEAVFWVEIQFNPTITDLKGPSRLNH